MTNPILHTDSNDTESKIIEVAKALFMENGYAETSMSDIAAKAGINRPVLHYYFRTKDRMFGAVFGTIVQQIFPKLQETMTAPSLSVAERITHVVDTYFEVFRKNPSLPLFIIREIHRDVNLIITTINASPMKPVFEKLVTRLNEEMEEGKLKRVPLTMLFYTLYGQMAFPFLTKGLVEKFPVGEAASFDDLLEQWKPYIVRQMEHLLCPSRA